MRLQLDYKEADNGNRSQQQPTDICSLGVHGAPSYKRLPRFHSSFRGRKHITQAQAVKFSIGSEKL